MGFKVQPETKHKRINKPKRPDDLQTQTFLSSIQTALVLHVGVADVIIRD